METTHQCILGDARRMDDVKDESIHLIVTSPPYWQLKDYGDKGQIGFNDTYEDYINNLNLVWKECYRALHPGCRMIINIGDQFARSVYYGRYKIIPIRTEIIKFCEVIGFDYMGAIIWQKKTTMNTTGGATVMGSYPYPRNGIIEIDYEFILIFKKPGKAPKVEKDRKEQSKIPKQKWKEYFSGHWYLNAAKQDAHIAVFPVELPKRAIEMFTFVGDSVLDPFLGSGTTSLAALITNRNSIGYEINKDFLNVIKSKLNINKYPLFKDGNFVVKEQKNNNINLKKEINKLDYVFTDPVNFDKKIDPNKLKFGSKISTHDNGPNAKREQYYIVKEILAPNLIRLNNDLIIRLIGVKPNLQTDNAAINFLNKKIRKRHVYLKYDQTKYDKNNHLMAYVYMKNKTFVNAHLLKKGLVEIDKEFPFKLLKKYQFMSKEKSIDEKTS